MFKNNGYDHKQYFILHICKWFFWSPVYNVVFINWYCQTQRIIIIEKNGLWYAPVSNYYNNLPAVENRYQKLKQKINSLEIRKLNSNRTLQDLRKRILTQGRG
jgi:hypothetical protein